MECRIVSGPCELVFSFDLDYTLLKPISGNKFPKHRNDATLVYPEVQSTLELLHYLGYKVVIFTNQKGLGKKISKEDLYYKVDNYLPYGSTYDIYISYKSDQYRKPAPGMFEAFMKHNGPVKSMFYVGDAAGRPGDFSASDRLFAYNCGLTFYTPETYFLRQTVNLPDIVKLQPPTPVAVQYPIAPWTVVILVGPPASGKSTIAQQIKDKYPKTEIVNNDTTGTAAKSLRLFKSLLGSRIERIVVDNNNATVKNRADYVQVARNIGYKVRILVNQLPESYLQHLNAYRAYTNKTIMIPTVAYRVYSKRYEPPTIAEGQIEYFVPNLPQSVFNLAF